MIQGIVTFVLVIGTIMLFRKSVRKVCGKE